MSHLAFHPLALSHWDRARLHGSGVLSWRKGAGEERAEFMVAHPVKVGVSTYGKPKRVAKRYLSGEFANMTVTDVAAQEGVTYGALRTALYKLGGIKGNKQQEHAA